MDTQGKLAVDFKPTKRMKKRRELDALLNGKQQGQTGGGRSCKPKNGKHELLQNDSESSEVEEYNYNMAAKGILQKNEYTQMCSTCKNLCWGFLLMCCLVSIGGLVWMCIQLKKDVDQLQNRLARIELANVNIPDQIQGFITVHEDFARQLELLKNGGDGVQGIHSNITHLSNQVFALESSLKTISSNVASNPQLQVLLSLPQQLKELSKNVAEMGSNLRTLDQTVQQLTTSRSHLEQQINDFDARLQSLQLDSRKNPVDRPANTQTSTETAQDEATSAREQPSGVKEEMVWLLANFRLLNTTVCRQMEELERHSKSSDISISELNNYTRLLNTRVSFIEMKPSTDELKQIVTDIIEDKFEVFHNSSSRERENDNEKIKNIFEERVVQLRLQFDDQKTVIGGLSDRLNDALTSLSQLYNSTNADILVLNETMEDMLARTKELTSIVRSIVSDNVSSESTPDDKRDNDLRQSSVRSTTKKPFEMAADPESTTKQYSLPTRNNN